MEGRVWLSIVSEIRKTGEPVEKYDFETEGKVFEKEGTQYIMYEESELSGMKGDKTVLKFRDGVCTMHRYGVHRSELIFEEGQKSETIYHTPYGNFDMTTLASKVIYNRASGHVELDYRLIIKGLSESKNKLKIKIRKQQD
jgi:uncharacterized beta-barrel protein YwiB (DUF1934 family)